MNLESAIGIFLGAYVCYVLFRWFARKSAVNSAHRSEMYELLTKEKYQVKGRFD